jgi:D-aminoacyl-tRNA deacylase
MIAVIQRVSNAKVKSLETDKESKIGSGMCILLGVAQDDQKEDLAKIVKKITNIRIFKDKDNKMNLSPQEAKAEVLLISQFTLLANSKKGNRPSFIKAAKQEKAESMYKEVIETLKENGLVVKTGFFGHYMEIDLKLDGPVTISLDSNKL